MPEWLGSGLQNRLHRFNSDWHLHFSLFCKQKSLSYMPVTAYAHTNIALVKYWGKHTQSGNLPAVGSLSLTLKPFGTKTTVTLTHQKTDEFHLNGSPVDPLTLPYQKVHTHLQRIRALAGSQQHCLVISENHVPTAAGLASSASGFAALTLAATKAYGLTLETAELSRLARMGSGSAARSLYGGFAYMPSGQVGDEKCYARPIKAADNLHVAMLIIPCAQGKKPISSTRAMLHTQATSAYYKVWIETHADDLEKGIRAVEMGDICALGETMEHSTLKMHASLMAARPGFWYFTPHTMAVIESVRTLRQQGYVCYFTMDAGPHVKVLCPKTDAPQLQILIAQYMQKKHGFSPVAPIEIAEPGPAAYILQGD